MVAIRKKNGKKVRHAHASRNPQLKAGISKYSRSASRANSKAAFVKAKNGGKFPVKAPAAKKDAVARKAPRWYPAENIGRARDRSKFRTWNEKKGAWVYKSHNTKLRSSITPGTVLIVLSGKYRGKRVVFLKQLRSGLLLITGPFKLSGVPLRRVNQAYVIATKTSVALPKIDMSKFDDNYFRKSKKAEKKVAAAAAKTEKKSVFAAKDGEKKKKNKRPRNLPVQKMKDQKIVDKPLLVALKATPFLKAYLRSEFALHKGEYPHRLQF